MLVIFNIYWDKAKIKDQLASWYNLILYRNIFVNKVCH